MEGATYYQPVFVSGERRALRVVRVTPGQENEPPLQEQGMGHLEDNPVYLSDNLDKCSTKELQAKQGRKGSTENTNQTLNVP